MIKFYRPNFLVESILDKHKRTEMFRKQNEGKPLYGRILIISKYFHINKEAGLINSSLLLLLYFLLLVAVPLFAILSIHSKIVSSSSKNFGAVAISQTEFKYLRPYFQIIESFVPFRNCVPVKNKL